MADAEEKTEAGKGADATPEHAETLIPETQDGPDSEGETDLGPVKPRKMISLGVLIGGGAVLLCSVVALGVVWVAQTRKAQAAKTQPPPSVVVPKPDNSAQRYQDLFGVSGAQNVAKDAPLPGVGNPYGDANGTHRQQPQGLGGEMPTPDVVAPDESASSSGSNQGAGYGDTGSGSGYDEASLMGASNGRPLVLPKQKNQKLEQYYADIAPDLPLVSPTKAAQRHQRSEAAAAKLQRERLPDRGTVLGGQSDVATPDYAPSNRVLKCRTVFSVDTTVPGGDIIGMVVDDYIWNGRVIVPRDTEVIGSVGSPLYESDKVGRLLDQGRWRFIFPAQPGRPNGRELVLRAKAHARRELTVEAESGRVRQWEKDADGRPGLPGRVFSLRDSYRLKKLGFDVLAGVGKASIDTLKDRETADGMAGMMGAQQDAPTMKNVGLESASAVTDAAFGSVSAEMQRKMSLMAEYVAVDGGTEFYLFVQEPILLDSAATAVAALPVARENNP